MNKSGTPKLKIGSTYVVNEAGTSYDTWFTFRMVTTLVETSSGTATTTLYYKLKGADDSTFTTVATATKAGSYGVITRTATHYAQFSLGANDYDYSYYLDNVSLIRTNDASYIPQ